MFAKQKKTELPRLYYSHTHTHTHTHTHLRELVALASVGAMMRWYNASKKVKIKIKQPALVALAHVGAMMDW